VSECVCVCSHECVSKCYSMPLSICVCICLCVCVHACMRVSCGCAGGGGSQKEKESRQRDTKNKYKGDLQVQTPIEGQIRRACPTSTAPVPILRVTCHTFILAI